MSTPTPSPLVPPQQQQQPQQSTRQSWTLASDILTARTGLFMHEKIAELRKAKAQKVLQQARFDAMTPAERYSYQGKYTHSSFPCDNCLLTNHHCVCDEFPDRNELTHNLNNYVDVVVYAHSGEVATLTASNTAHFLPRHGAYPVLMGDIRGESILRNLILSRPRDSVMVLFPSATSITPVEFMERYIALPKGPQHPFLDSYPPIPSDLHQDIVTKNAHIDEVFAKHQEEQIAMFTSQSKVKKSNLSADPRTNEILKLQQDRVYTESLIPDLIDDTIAEVFPGFCSSRQFYLDMIATNANTNKTTHNDDAQTPNPHSHSHKPLVIVLDGTWSNAKTLDRRLTLLMAEVFHKNQYDETNRLLTDPTITPANYLHRVRVTRALRSDVGQLRRLQSSERVTVAGAGLGFKAVHAMTQPGAKNSKSVMAERLSSDNSNNSQEAPSSPKAPPHTRTTPLNTGSPAEPTTQAPPETPLSSSSSTTTSLSTFSLPQDNSAKRGTVILEDDAVIEDNSGGKVSTLHAFLVLLEELYDLPIINSHRNLGLEKEQLKKSIPSEKKRTVLDIVAGFTDILQAMVIGYHTQKGLSKAQLLDPETRQIVKKKYQDFLDQKESARQSKSALNAAKKAANLDKNGDSTPNEPVSSSDGEEHLSKKQRLGGGGGDDDASGVHEMVSISTDNSTK